VSSRDDAREKGVPRRRYKECLSIMFILLSDTCIKNKLTRDYRAKLHPGTFQKYRLFLYLYVGGGGQTPPFVYTFEVHVLGLLDLEVSTSSTATSTVRGRSRACMRLTS
jgi:hypothetical protein